jgi:hypothetical protein
MSLRRLTRLANAFSKKLENLRAAVAPGAPERPIHENVPGAFPAGAIDVGHCLGAEQSYIL